MGYAYTAQYLLTRNGIRNEQIRTVGAGSGRGLAGGAR